MRNLVCLSMAVASVAVSLITSAASAEPTLRPELVIYTYDSLNAKGGLGPIVFPVFERRCGCRVRVITSGDAGQSLARVKLDQSRGKLEGQVLLGIDQNLWTQARELGDEWNLSWQPEGYANLAAELRAPGSGFLPFDHGVFSFIADTKALADKKLRIPRRLKDLLAPEFKRSLALEDPRTSTPGLALVLHTRSVLGEGAWNFWHALRSQWLTLAPGWDQAYGLFMKGEAPLVWSYTTSQAYHVEHGDSAGRYRALIFEDGNPVQIEGAMLLKDGIRDEATRKRARDFLSFLLSREVQREIPKGNWMLPVVDDTELPPSFRALPHPVKLTGAAGPSPADPVRETTQRWARAIR